MKLYVYVPKNDLTSIKKYGLLSNRAQYELFGKFNWRKYIHQYYDAYKKYASLRIIINDDDSIQEKIIKYLDWRTSPHGEGSKAIYVLYAPIPDDPEVHEFIKKHRGNFLKDKILLHLNCRQKIYSIGPRITREQITDREYWINIWKKQKNDGLWFDGIPHGYIIPHKGLLSVN